LLLSEPGKGVLSVALPALKISVSKRAKERPFWQARYYHFNVLTQEKRLEKRNYMHRNPVRRGLVENNEDWRWSSACYYRTGGREGQRSHLENILRG
jgi:putative transposase